MTRNIIITTAFLISLLSPNLHGQEVKPVRLPVSLQDAYKMAIENSSGLKAATGEEEIAKAKLKQAKAMLMPSLSFSETFLRTDDQVGVFGSKLRQGEFTTQDFDLARLNNPSGINNFESKIWMNMPLFTSGMNYYMNKAAKKGVEASERSTKYNQSFIKSNVAKVYWGVLSAEESSSYMDEGIKHLERLEKSYKLIAAPNSATTTCFLLSQATRMALAQKKEYVEAMKNGLKTTLISLLEIPDNRDIVLTDTIPDDFETKSYATIDGSLLRQDLESLKLNLSGLKMQKKSIKSLFGPRIDFFGGFAFNTPDFTKGENAYQLGLVLTFNIFDYSRYGKLQEVRAREAQLENMIKENSKNIGSAGAKALSAFNGKKKELKFAKGSFEKADEAMRFADLRYREGTLALKDFSDAIAHWVEARVNVAKTRYDLASSFIDLQFERGEL